MKKHVVGLVIFVVLTLGSSVFAQSAQPTLYITPTPDNFEVYLAAAIVKKKTPVTVVTKQESADYVLQASAVEIQQQSGASKVARCLFAYCNGIEDRGTTSVQVTQGERVVWCLLGQQGPWPEEPSGPRRGSREALRQSSEERQLSMWTMQRATDTQAPATGATSQASSRHRRRVKRHHRGGFGVGLGFVGGCKALEAGHKAPPNASSTFK